MAINTRMTAAAFLQQPETNLPVELINGEVMMSPTPVPAHQRAVGRIFKLLDSLIPDGEVFVAPLDVYLDEANVVQPDVMWVAEKSACTILDSYVQGAPDLVVEVLSPSTARHDKSTKFRLYEQYGAREYWLVDPQAEFVEVWQRENEDFALSGVFGPGDTFDSPALGKSIDANRIFGD